MQNRFVKKIILILPYFFFIDLFAQNNQIDSLYTSLKISKDDTSKVNTLIALSKQLRQTGKMTEAKKCLEDAVSLAEKINFEKGIAGAYNNLGIFYFNQRNYDRALENYRTSLKTREKMNDRQGIADCYHNIALAYHNMGRYPDAIKNYYSSIKAKEKIGDKDGMAKSYSNIGLIYVDLHNYSEALKSQFNALNLFKETGFKLGIASTINNIGYVYHNQGNYSEALKYYSDALKKYEELGNKGALIDRYSNIGFIYENQGNYPEALKNHLNALKVSEEIKCDDCLAVAQNNIADLYCHQGINESDSSQKKQLFNRSLDYYSNALKIFNKEDDKEGVAGCYNGMGEVYFELKNYAKAKQLSDDGLSLFKEIGLIGNVRNSYQNLVRIDSANGDWEEAYSNQQLYFFYRDSIVNEESAKKIMKSQMQFDYDRKEDSLRYQQGLADAKLRQQVLLSEQQKQTLVLKEKELALVGNEKKLQQLQLEKNKVDYDIQKAENDKKQDQLALLNKEKLIQSLQLNKQKHLTNYLVYGLVLILLLSFFAYRSYHNRQQLNLQTLRNKIASDLHDDVGSTLSSISIFSQMAQQQSKETIPLLETIGESSRKMLDAMADIVWTINPENDQFEKIILRMRSFAYELLGAKKIDFEFVAEDDVAKMKLPMEVRKNLYLIFKEATNNMVKYSSANKAMFAIKGEKNSLTMTISDDGKGFDVNKSTGGNGLKNMKKRAAEIGGQLIINSNPGSGTMIELKVAV